MAICLNNKMGLKYIYFIGFLFFFMPFVYADVSLGSFPSVLNIGDNLPINASLYSQSAETAFLTLSLNCNNETLEFYKSPISIRAREKTMINNILPLTNSFLSGLKGSCYVEAKYGLDSASGDVFRISEKIELFLQIEKSQFEAGEIVELSGRAVKENGQLANGIAVLKVKDILEERTSIANGSFSINFSFPSDSKSGNYIIEVEAFEEKEDKEKLNSGKASLNRRIVQTPKKIEIALSSQSVKPGETFKITSSLYDQADDLINQEIEVAILGVNGEKIVTVLADSGAVAEIETKTNYTSGYWKVVGTIENISSERTFFIEEFADISVEQANGIISVTNIGNSIYNKPFELGIGENLVSKNMSLSPGETTRFKISAPDGEYDLAIPGKNQTFSRITLTGRSINVEQLGEGSRWKVYLSWIIIALVAVGGVVLMARKFSFTRSVKYPEMGFSAGVRDNLARPNKPLKPMDNNSNKAGSVNKGFFNEAESGFKIAGRASLPTESEYSLVIRGEKQDAGIVAVKHSGAFEKEIREIGKQYKGVPYVSGSHILLLFMPSLTKTMKNENLAIKTADEISSFLKKKQQDFGVGVHYGTLVTNISSGKLQFTSLENATLIAKKMADISTSELLLSKEAVQKAGSDIRTQRINKDGSVFYSLSKFIDTQSNERFISDFMKRNF